MLFVEIFSVSLIDELPKILIDCYRKFNQFLTNNQ